jgi:hypothetical protein
MSSSPSMKRNVAFAGICLPLAFLLMLPAGPVLAVHAADYVVIQGNVDRVSGMNIAVAGHDYNVAAARVISPSAKELPFSEIAPGRKVSLFLTRSGVTTVVVYPTPMVE